RGAAGARSVALHAARRVQDALPQRLAVPLRRLSDGIGLTEYLSPTLPAARGISQRSIYNLIHDARQGRAEAVQARIEEIASRRLLNHADRAVIGAARALLDHAEAGTGEALPLLWWDKPYPGNYGDWLSPLILQQVTGRPVRFQRHDQIRPGPHLMAVGSIGRFARKSSILVGTGFSRADTEIAPDATYVSLRGPYSARLVAEAGGPRIERFGDPAAILPRLIPLTLPKRTNGRLALVRHFAHRRISLRLPEHMDEHSVLVSRRTEIEALIGTLLRYDAVLTSAMHVYITCQAYGIPVGLITFEGFEDAVSGDQMKYRDYAAGVGLPERLPQAIGPDLRHRDLTALVEHDRIPAPAMDAVESALAEAVAAYDRVAPGAMKQMIGGLREGS
uniref:polysaccharide pyruvyl transferase family protein n=1 Tax=Paracoccus binzhouensis TaxID=2796149 RepID=UPI0018EF32C4